MPVGEKTERLARMGSVVAGVILVLTGVSFLGGIYVEPVILGLGYVGFGLFGILTGAMVIARRPRWRIVGIGYAALLVAATLISMLSEGWDLGILALAVIPSAFVIGALVWGRSVFTTHDIGITMEERSARAWVKVAGILLVLGGIAFGFMGFLYMGFSEGDDALAALGLALLGLGLAGVVIGAMVIARRRRWRVIGIGYAALALILTVVEVVSTVAWRGEMWPFWVIQAVPPAIVIGGLVTAKGAFTPRRNGPSLPPRPDPVTLTPAMPRSG